MDAHNIVARLLYRDALMLVIDKPAGLPVHAGPRGGRTLSDSLDGLRFGLLRRPQAAHRLDSETAGCLVLGRHRQALARLGRLFESGAVGKTYWAVVDGAPPGEAGEIDLPIARRSSDPADWTMKADRRAAFAHALARPRPPGGPGLAGTGAAHRTHASAARSLRRERLADPRRSHLWWRACRRGTAAASGPGG